MNYQLPKSERLHAQKSIKELFNEGSSFFLYPFKVLYLKHGNPEELHVQVLFSVSKRKFKKAVTRNLLKRRMREAYRLNKHSLQISGKGLYLGLIYVGSEPMPYAALSEKIKAVLAKVSTQISESNEHYE